MSWGSRSIVKMASEEKIENRAIEDNGLGKLLSGFHVKLGRAYFHHEKVGERAELHEIKNYCMAEGIMKEAEKEYSGFPKVIEQMKGSLNYASTYFKLNGRGCK